MIVEATAGLGAMAMGKLHIAESENYNGVFPHTSAAIRHEIDVESELVRFEAAKSYLLEQMELLKKKALQELGQEMADIFASYKMMIQDKAWNNTILEGINREHLTAERAIRIAKDRYVSIFDAMEDTYMRERATDIIYLAGELLNILAEERAEENRTDEEKTDTKTDESLIFEEAEPSADVCKYILLTDYISPSQVLTLDTNQYCGIVSRYGSVYSHAAILAHHRKIPMLMGVDYSYAMEGMYALVDGDKKLLWVETDRNTLLETVQVQPEENKKEANPIPELGFYANINSVSELSEEIVDSIAGIGLYRSEYQYMMASHEPEEEELFLEYKALAENMKGKPVVIRTLDVGGDKALPYFDMPQEENPALGCRGIRFSLKHPKAFMRQLRAIYRAGAYGNISVMFPMISSINEVYQVKELIAKVQQDLEQQHIPYQVRSLGIMVETPAAVMISDLLAKEVDFFSIGTNDLAQYTMAADRLNSQVYEVYDSNHEAIYRMIATVTENAHKEACSVCVCGELASDANAVQRLKQLGVDILSVQLS